MRFEVGNYYRAVIPLGDPSVVIPHKDVLDWPFDLALYGSDVLLCHSIGSRRGKMGRWAGLLARRDQPVGFFVRVSRNGIPSGNWAKIPPLEVLALAADGRA